MSATAPSPRRVGARLSAAVAGAWALVTGVAPHVLHHVGPLAGAALLAGFGGRAIFFTLGLLLSLPLLRRLYRRSRTFLAPVLAVVVFAGLFAFSSFVIAPRLTGGSEKAPAPGVELPTGHASHHGGGK